MSHAASESMNTETLPNTTGARPRWLWRFVRRLSAFAWREEIARAEAGYQCLARNSAKLQERYNELIYEVAQKHDGESRHDTARRYIRERESRIEGPACDASPNDKDVPRAPSAK